MTDKEYIDREAAKIAFQNMDAGSRVPSTLLTPEEFAEYLDDIPTADVVPVKHGEWEHYTYSIFYGTDENSEPIYRDRVLYYCSECRHGSSIKTNYCPNCGAKFDGDVSNVGNN